MVDKVQVKATRYMAAHLIIDLIDDNTEVVTVSIPAMVEEDRRPRLLGQEGFGLTHSKILEGFPQGFLTTFKDTKNMCI